MILSCKDITIYKFHTYNSIENIDFDNRDRLRIFNPIGELYLLESPLMELQSTGFGCLSIPPCPHLWSSLL